MLFVLVGAEVDIGYAAAAGLAAVATVLGVLCFRAVGVLLCVAGSRLSGRERLFAVLAYLPKATVQAAIGGVPLGHGPGLWAGGAHRGGSRYLGSLPPWGPVAIDLQLPAPAAPGQGIERQQRGAPANAGAPPPFIQDALSTAWRRRG